MLLSTYDILSVSGRNEATMTDEPVEQPAEMTQPVIIDLGKQKAKKIKALKEGKGKLWDDTLAVVAEVKEVLGEDADSKVLIPVILIYEKKTRRPRLERMIFPRFK
jgi:hypothetical protein